MLRVWGVTADEAILAWHRAHARADFDAKTRLGSVLADLTDPFGLEVHEPITVEGPDTLQPLPPYVARGHDTLLAELVGKAAGGTSSIAVLLGESSTGKTRALWEALAALRTEPGWRLWHPRSPTRRQELVAGLAQVRPRTVVWLNETQRYFAELSAEDQEAIANSLNAVLNDQSRAPVLILGSLWREHYNVLCADPGSATRRLLSRAIIEVPPAFTGQDLAAMQATARGDRRLAHACQAATDGKITQYLAGGPELIDRYERQVGVAARALITAGMDAVRLGHPNLIPLTLLRAAAPGYLSDAELDELTPDWFESALAETNRGCKGARGPLTGHHGRAAARRQQGRRGTTSTGPAVYVLADYLDQYAHRHRAHLIPPIEFWEAVGAHAVPEHQHRLANAAWGRGQYRDAAQLWKNATRHGNAEAGLALFTKLHGFSPVKTAPRAGPRFTSTSATPGCPLCCAHWSTTAPLTRATSSWREWLLLELQ
ncbi:hypothetical protein ACIA5E_18110 [Nocardia asteroides]|uniref:hypothetical protein n=1 Tax=Nocardia asteroides TaxID=1824 RepID=UPI0037AC1206